MARYRAIEEAGKLADRQLGTLKRALMNKDRWDAEAVRMLEMKKQCKSLKDPEAFSRYLAENLRRAYKTGADDVRSAIRNALQID